MSAEMSWGQPEVTSRRSFLKKLAIVGAAVSALPLLKGPFIRQAGSNTRAIPADLPGEGSIFQPRNDTRRQR